LGPVWALLLLLLLLAIDRRCRCAVLGVLLV
jgi:hypothetical protein